MMIQIRGRRTCCDTGETSDTDLWLEIAPGDSVGAIVLKLSGGVTGYESMYLTHEAYTNLIAVPRDWLANIGSRDYDQLVVPKEELVRALRAYATK